MYVPGDHWVICDRCGHKIRRSQARKTWEGLLVCHRDWEPKHPQLSVTAKGDKQSVIDARPDVGGENFISAGDVTATNLDDPDNISDDNIYFSLKTTATSASTGDNKIYLTDTTGITAGSSIGITLDNNIVQWVPTTYISDPIVYFDGTLDDDVASGSRVYDTEPVVEDFVTDPIDPGTLEPITEPEAGEITQDAPEGSTEIEVNFPNAGDGNTIIIGLDDSTNQTTTISDVDDTTIIITDPLHSPASAGRKVYTTIPETLDGWVSYFSDSYWEVVEGDLGTWNGSAWVSTQEEGEDDFTIQLSPVGDWEVGFRPTKMRVTHTHPAETYENGFLLYNACIGGGCPDYIVEDANLLSLKEKDCFFDGYDIRLLDMISNEEEAGSFTITNIEFYIG